jgi:UDP-GlcNAc:undecaprenyl-phosphate GlcNAc-1-phosphate transferase
MNIAILLFLISAFTGTLLLSFLSLQVVKKKANAGGYFMDMPEGRKIHKSAIPRIGGISFAVVTILISFYVFNFSIHYLWYFCSAGSIFLLGFFDDLSERSWKLKLVCQFLIGSFALSAFQGVFPKFQFFHFNFYLPGIVVFALFMVWFLGILNAVNLVDGMDGLAGGVMVIISLGASYLGWVSGKEQFMMLYLGLSVSLFAFLFYNGKPAKFFMGDAGSLFLGFHVAVMPLLFYFDSNILTSTLELTPFMLFSTYFILDTLRVFFERIKLKRNPLLPDNNHLHHRLLKATSSYNTTLIIIFSLVLVSVLFALSLFNFGSSYYSLIIFLVLILLFIVLPKVHLFLVSIMEKLVKRVRVLIRGARKKELVTSATGILYLQAAYFILLLLSKEHYFLYAHYLVLLIPVLFFLYKKKVILDNTLISFLLFTQYLILMSEKRLYFYVFNYIDLFRWAVLGYILFLGFRFFFYKSLLYLMRFWTIKDILFVVIWVGVFLLILVQNPVPASIPNLTMLVELLIVYLSARLIIW